MAGQLGDNVAGCGDEAFAEVARRPAIEKHRINVGGFFELECYDPDGNLKWKDKAENEIVNEGLEHILDIVFASGTQQQIWYVGITQTTPTVASGDTMSSHSGWDEFAQYDEAARPQYVEVRTARQVSNSASKADFTISQDSSTIGGAFISSDSTSSGSSGTLMCAAAFTGGDKSADDDDTLQVTYNITAANDGA